MNEKHKLMKPKDPARSGRQASRRAKKWQRLSALLLTFLMFAGFFSSCVDEFPSVGMDTSQARAEEETVTGVGLIQQEDGTWMSQNCRVPIVGPGRVVTEINRGGLLNVGSGISSNSWGNVVDTDLTNSAKMNSLVGADLGTIIVSVRDLHHTYSEGQKVGFVYSMLDENNVTVLSAEILKGLGIQLYKNGTQVGDTYLSYDEKQGSFLDLDLLAISGKDGKSESVIAVDAEDDFDEVRLVMTGLNADVLSSQGKISVKYAFVGENPEIRATAENEFKWYWGENSPTIADNLTIINPENIVDDKNNTYATFVSVGSGGVYRLVVDFQKEIPAGMEVGYKYYVGGLLEGGLGAQDVTLTAQDKEGESTGDVAGEGGSVLGVSLFANEEQASSMILTVPCRRLEWYKTEGVLSFAGGHIYNAYVREPVKLDPVNYFTIGDDETYRISYKLATPTIGKVTYDILDRPTGANPIISTNNTLQGMTVSGKYKIIAYYEDPNGNKVSQTVTITKKTAVTEEGCNNYITETNCQARVEDKAYDSEGALITVIQDTQNQNNIIDSNPNNYATYHRVASVIGADAITSITTDTPIKIESDMRVGFEVQAITGLLDLTALNSYRIAVYNKGKLVVDSQVGQGEILNLGVLNFDNSRIRLSVNISKDTAEEFDHIELWDNNVLALTDALKVYNAFYENTKCTEEGANEACMEVMTDIGYGLEIDYAHTETGGVLGLVSGGLGNLDDIVDGSLDTYSTVNGGLLAVGSGVKLGFKFNKLPKKQPIGIVLKGSTDILKADVLSRIQIKAYNDETYVGESAPDFTTADVNLISKNGKTYIEIYGENLPQNYNRIEVTVAGIATLASYGLQICGIYTRPDTDGDGIPDCADDYTLTDINGLSIDVNHICEGDPNPVFTITSGGAEGQNYILNFQNFAYDDKELIQVQVRAEEGKLVFDTNLTSRLSPGYYGITVDQIVDLNKICFLSVHPLETTWLGYSADWNDWDNWSNGVPWGCTNVVIPSPDATASEVLGIPEGFNGVKSYPDLTKGLSRSEIYDEPYCCNNIYFAPGAELVGQYNLHYSGKVFIDTELKSGAYHLMSAPLQAMVTGDMFVTQNVTEWESWRETSSDNKQHPNYFMPIDGEKHGNGDNPAYIEQRINPYIYQRFWNSAVRNETLTRSYNTTDKAITEFTDWSRSFNAVETNYEVGQGFALKAGDGTNATYHFHFPKSFSIYNYYGINGNSLKGSSIARTGQIGRLWTAEQINGLTLKRETSGTLYIFGNPFMAHINIKKFLAKNTGVTCVKIYQNGEYVDINNNNVADAAQIAPMQAVFLTATAGTRLRITLSEDMLEQGKSSTRLTRRMANQVRLTATSNGYSASCVVVSSSSGNDNYNSREDVTLLIGSEEGSGVAVYTIADGKALSIQRMKSVTRIPVGFYLKQAGNVNLAFDASDDIWNSWRLKDQQTGRSYPLKGKITLDNVSTSSERFFLERVQ